MDAGDAIKHLDCDDYLVSLTGFEDEFVAWEKYKNFPDGTVDVGIKVSTCKGSDPCKQDKFFYYKSFTVCSSGSFITYAGYLKPGFMALFECIFPNERKYFIFYHHGDDKPPVELKIETFPDNIIPSSLLYTLESPKLSRKIFAFQTASLSNTSPVIFAIDR